MQAWIGAGLAIVLSVTAYGSEGGQIAPQVTPRMLLETTDISGVALSPDGQSVAFRTETASIERNTYDTVWYVQDIETPGPALPIADGGVPLRDSSGFALAEIPAWSTDSRWLYYRALIDDQVQVWRAARDGSRAEPVSRDAANVERFLLAEHGRRLLYQVGATREQIQRAELAEYDRGILFDDTIFGQQHLFRALPINGRLASQRTIHAHELLWNTPKTIRAVDLDTLQTRDASEQEVAAFMRRSASPADTGARAIVYSSDGNRSAVLTGTYPASELHVSEAGRNQVESCDACTALTIEALAWRNDEELIFTTRDTARDFAQSIYAWRPGDNDVRLIAASDGLLSGDRFGHSSTCAVGSRYAACVAASAGVAPRLERIDLDTGTTTTLTDPNQRLSELGQRRTDLEFLSWQDAAGRSFTGHLLTPAQQRADERVPLFITYFRCPGYLRGGFGDEWPLLSLAGNGIAALCISRPVLPSVRDQTAADDYQAALSGISAIIEILDRRGTIDHRRVGMGGLSYGSEVTAWVAGKSDLLSAASVATNQVSPTWYWFSARIADRADAIRHRWELGAPDETPQQWEKMSPVYFAEQFNAPLLMQIPEGEYRSNIEFYIRMVRLGKPAELWIYPNETHRKQRPRSKLAAYERNLDWFRFWLQGDEDPSPLKTEQYARWRALRERQSE